MLLRFIQPTCSSSSCLASPPRPSAAARQPRKRRAWRAASGALQLARKRQITSHAQVRAFLSVCRLVLQVGREDQLGTATGPYQLTYLDDDMLIGRAVTLGSSFIFVRAKEFDN